ncbi:MAG: cytochrome c3 family protein [Verrucomicrobiia bacterium]
MKKTNFRITIAALLAIVGLSIFAFSCATLDRVIVAPPMIPGAKYVGMETCQPCHEKEVRDFKFAAHARVAIPDGKGKREGQGCESCHGPGSLHVEAGGERGKFIINPTKNPEACFQCHLDKQAEFSLPYHHPVKEGRMNCTTCHNPHGHDIKLGKGQVVGRLNENCSQCHREQTRPHVFAHAALREGCTTCHAVHGSINSKMLVQRDNNLCLKCHAQVGANPAGGNPVRPLLIGGGNHNSSAGSRLAQGNCWNAGCHTAVHGSNLNPAFRY